MYDLILASVLALLSRGAHLFGIDSFLLRPSVVLAE